MRGISASTSCGRHGSARRGQAVTFCSRRRPRRSSAQSLPEGVSVFPLGERHLKGLDEPERVYELEIEGVTAQQPVQEPERSAAADVHEEDIGKKLKQRIEESIMRMVDAGLKKLTPTPEPSPDTDVEELAERGASLDDSIRAKVDAALRAHGISSKES